MSTPSISIIVPIYNVEAYLPCCLDSLVNQTFTDIEIICVDDGSTDGSAAILADYAARDTRIRVITQANAGQGAARNRALDVAESPYIMFCDSDDWYEQNMCEKMLAALIACPQADMVMCGYRNEWEREPEENEELAWLEKISFSGFQKPTAEVMRESLVGAHFKIYRKELIKQEHIRFPEGVRYEDYYFWNVCAAHARGVYYLPDRLYHYRQREGSTMHDSFKKKKLQNIDYIHIGILLWRYFHARGLEEIWGGMVADMWAQMVINARRYSSDTDTLSHITHLIREFVESECKATDGRLSPLLLQALILSLDIPTLKKKSMGGLLRRHYTQHKINVRMLGLVVYQIRCKGEVIRWRAFGIPYRKLHKGNTHISKERFQNKYYMTFYPAFIQRINELYTVSLSYSPRHQAYILSSSTPKV